MSSPEWPGERGIGLQRGQNRPAIHIRHQHIESDGIGMLGLSEPQSLLSICGGDHVQAFPVQKALHQVAHRRVVVDDEHRRLLL